MGSKLWIDSAWTGAETQSGQAHRPGATQGQPTRRPGFRFGLGGLLVGVTLWAVFLGLTVGRTLTATMVMAEFMLSFLFLAAFLAVYDALQEAHPPVLNVVVGGLVALASGAVGFYLLIQGIGPIFFA